ncbi:MAG: ferritin family protein [Hyphomicrobiales bacterium]|nr:ferritin family protein [Hyphomicrobiales bacterium]
MTENENTAKNPVEDMPTMLAYAHRIEVEAAERYGMLADQMEIANNTELAALFRTMEKVEGKHADHIVEKAGPGGIPQFGPLDYRWEEGEGPETLDLTDIHYKMTPWHALQLALAAEKRAYTFFARLAKEAYDKEVQALAREFAEEEEEHIEFVTKEMKKYSRPEAGWDEDLDPPNHPD